eukprot:g3532.t1
MQQVLERWLAHLPPGHPLRMQDRRGMAVQAVTIRRRACPVICAVGFGKNKADVQTAARLALSVEAGLQALERGGDDLIQSTPFLELLQQGLIVHEQAAAAVDRAPPGALTSSGGDYGPPPGGRPSPGQSSSMPGPGPGGPGGARGSGGGGPRGDENVLITTSSTTSRKEGHQMPYSTEEEGYAGGDNFYQHNYNQSQTQYNDISINNYFIYNRVQNTVNAYGADPYYGDGGAYGEHYAEHYDPASGFRTQEGFNYFSPALGDQGADASALEHDTPTELETEDVSPPREETVLDRFYEALRSKAAGVASAASTGPKRSPPGLSSTSRESLNRPPKGSPRLDKPPDAIDEADSHTMQVLSLFGNDNKGAENSPGYNDYQQQMKRSSLPQHQSGPRMADQQQHQNETMKIRSSARGGGADAAHDENRNDQSGSKSSTSSQEENFARADSQGGSSNSGLVPSFLNSLAGWSSGARNKSSTGEAHKPEKSLISALLEDEDGDSDSSESETERYNVYKDHSYNSDDEGARSDDDDRHARGDLEEYEDPRDRVALRDRRLPQRRMNMPQQSTAEREPRNGEGKHSYGGPSRPRGRDGAPRGAGPPPPPPKKSHAGHQTNHHNSGANPDSRSGSKNSNNTGEYAYGGGSGHYGMFNSNNQQNHNSSNYGYPGPHHKESRRGGGGGGGWASSSSSWARDSVDQEMSDWMTQNDTGHLVGKKVYSTLKGQHQHQQSGVSAHQTAGHQQDNPSASAPAPPAVAPPPPPSSTPPLQDPYGMEEFGEMDHGDMPFFTYADALKAKQAAAAAKAKEEAAAAAGKQILGAASSTAKTVVADPNKIQPMRSLKPNVGGAAGASTTGAGSSQLANKGGPSTKEPNMLSKTKSQSSPVDGEGPSSSSGVPLLGSRQELISSKDKESVVSDDTIPSQLSGSMSENIKTEAVPDTTAGSKHKKRSTGPGATSSVGGSSISNASGGKNNFRGQFISQEHAEREREPIVLEDGRVLSTVEVMREVGVSARAAYSGVAEEAAALQAASKHSTDVSVAEQAEALKASQEKLDDAKLLKQAVSVAEQASNTGKDKLQHQQQNKKKQKKIGSRTEKEDNEPSLLSQLMSSSEEREKQEEENARTESEYSHSRLRAGGSSSSVKGGGDRAASTLNLNEELPRPPTRQHILYVIRENQAVEIAPPLDLQRFIDKYNTDDVEKKHQSSPHANMDPEQYSQYCRQQLFRSQDITAEMNEEGERGVSSTDTHDTTCPSSSASSSTEQISSSGTNTNMHDHPQQAFGGVNLARGASKDHDHSRRPSTSNTAGGAGGKKKKNSKGTAGAAFGGAAMTTTTTSSKMNKLNKIMERQLALQQRQDLQKTWMAELVARWLYNLVLNTRPNIIVAILVVLAGTMYYSGSCGAAFQKVSVEELVVAPVFNLVFLTCEGVLAGESVGDSVRKYLAKFRQLQLSNMVFWYPTNLVNFYGLESAGAEDWQLLDDEKIVSLRQQVKELQASLDDTKSAKSGLENQLKKCEVELKSAQDAFRAQTLAQTETEKKLESVRSEVDSWRGRLAEEQKARKDKEELLENKLREEKKQFEKNLAESNRVIDDLTKETQMVRQNLEAEVKTLHQTLEAERKNLAASAENERKTAHLAAENERKHFHTMLETNVKQHDEAINELKKQFNEERKQFEGKLNEEKQKASEAKRQWNKTSDIEKRTFELEKRQLSDELEKMKVRMSEVEQSKSTLEQAKRLDEEKKQDQISHYQKKIAGLEAEVGAKVSEALSAKKDRFAMEFAVSTLKNERDLLKNASSTAENELRVCRETVKNLETTLAQTRNSADAAESCAKDLEKQLEKKQLEIAAVNTDKEKALQEKHLSAERLQSAITTLKKDLEKAQKVEIELKEMIQGANQTNEQVERENKCTLDKMKKAVDDLTAAKAKVEKERDDVKSNYVELVETTKRSLEAENVKLKTEKEEMQNELEKQKEVLEEQKNELEMYRKLREMD